jgi:hypothetical protein
MRMYQRLLERACDPYHLICASSRSHAAGGVNVLAAAAVSGAGAGADATTGVIDVVVALID